DTPRPRPQRKLDAGARARLITAEVLRQSQHAPIHQRRRSIVSAIRDAQKALSLGHCCTMVPAIVRTREPGPRNPLASDLLAQRIGSFTGSLPGLLHL